MGESGFMSVNFDKSALEVGPVGPVGTPVSLAGRGVSQWSYWSYSLYRGVYIKRVPGGTLPDPCIGLYGDTRTSGDTRTIGGILRLPERSRVGPGRGDSGARVSRPCSRNLFLSEQDLEFDDA